MVYVNVYTYVRTSFLYIFVVMESSPCCIIIPLLHFVVTTLCGMHNNADAGFTGKYLTNTGITG